MTLLVGYEVLWRTEQNSGTHTRLLTLAQQNQDGQTFWRAARSWQASDEPLHGRTYSCGCVLGE